MDIARQSALIEIAALYSCDFTIFWIYWRKNEKLLLATDAIFFLSNLVQVKDYLH